MNKPPLSATTQLCMSLSGRPGRFGTRFHNFLYDALALDFVYKAFTTTDLPAAIGGIRALGIRGCAVSMPFKEACIPFVDELDVSAAALKSVNTIVNDGGRLRAYNTDYLAVRQLLDTHHVSRTGRVALHGSGGMARAVAFALRDAGFHDVVIVARNETAGRQLAGECTFHWQSEATCIDAPVLVNTTPIGMAGGPDADRLPFDLASILAAQTVFDVVAAPVDTPLIRAAAAAGKHLIDGGEVIALQAAAQFALYTGVQPPAHLVRDAAAFALSD